MSTFIYWYGSPEFYRNFFQRVVFSEGKEEVCQLKTLQSVQVTDHSGSIKITKGEDGVIRFATQPGQRYTITAN
jgi:hypothetical protein